MVLLRGWLIGPRPGTGWCVVSIVIIRPQPWHMRLCSSRDGEAGRGPLSGGCGHPALPGPLRCGDTLVGHGTLKPRLRWGGGGGGAAHLYSGHAWSTARVRGGPGAWELFLAGPGPPGKGCPHQGRFPRKRPGAIAGVKLVAWTPRTRQVPFE